MFEYWANLLKSVIGVPPAGSSLVLVDRSDKVFNVDCAFTQYTTEWTVPMDEAKETVREIKDWLEKEYEDPEGVRASMPVEIRFSAPDDIWLSPGTGRVNCWIGIVKYKLVSFPSF